MGQGQREGAVPAALVAQAADAAGIGTWDYDPRTGACCVFR